VSGRAGPYVGALVALAIFATDARAQLSEVRLDRGPASDLYIRKRPPVPEPPRIPDELRVMLEETEQRADAKRTEAIGLLRAFLDSNPTGDGRAEALFKLAELLWEESRRTYIARMDRYERRLEACRLERGGCRKPPAEPRLDLSEPESLYRTLLADHPTFRRTDLVLYLVGFAAKEAERHDESLRFFQAVIERYPGSPLYGDAWMMIGEYYFATERWQQAREAYGKVLARPDAPTYDLALFKSAWCDWKVGEVELAARRFKQVLDLAVEGERVVSAGAR
jgi:cellulose synthase operon protein C